MENIKYIGEHLLPGVIGKSSIYISFVMYLVSTLLHMSKSARCINIAKYVFTIASICLLVTISVLFYIIYNHYFEYSYVFAHSSKEMPLHFIVSCFWEGQEGSFLLWAFWQALLTFIVLRFLPNIWRPKFMIVVNISQAFIVSMILGVEILGTKIGTSPFMLLRDIMSAVPVFKDPNYIKKFVIDGNGLNPLLQNYWMVIHPPVLFLGYASTLIPFAIVVAGLLMRKYKELVSLVMPWLLFSVLTLGIGIIMGAFWAYEALSFGGFWAWDPVENASLVPWLVLVGALHATIAFTKTSRSYKTVVILTLLSYILVLYASFLTRSGILGDTSVHSFIDLGMSMQLAIFVITFLIASIIVLSLRFKQLPVVISEEKISSREFWLFIGAVLLFLSSFQIIVVTSIPVINKLFSTNIAPPTDIISHYNKFQIPFAIMAMCIAGFAQFLNYKTTNMSKFYSRVGVYAVVSLIISLLFSFYVGVYKNPFFVVLIFSATLCLLSNIRFVRNYFKNKKALQTGDITAHIGFAVMLLGALISTSTRQVISFNAENYDYGDGFDEKSRGENMLLIKGQTKKMSKYLVSYVEENAKSIIILFCLYFCKAGN
ncbi:MAG: cytochrome c biogenesis protein CcsA [Solitalea-like symbiont of Acarus siro]